MQEYSGKYLVLEEDIKRRIKKLVMVCWWEVQAPLSPFRDTRYSSGGSEVVALSLFFASCCLGDSAVVQALDFIFQFLS